MASEEEIKKHEYAKSVAVMLQGRLTGYILIEGMAIAGVLFAAFAKGFYHSAALIICSACLFLLLYQHMTFKSYLEKKYQLQSNIKIIKE